MTGRTLLHDTRYRAARMDKALVVPFSGNAVTVLDGKTDMPVSVLVVPTLDQVNYDTTLGDNMIVFSGRGTALLKKRAYSKLQIP